MAGEYSAGASPDDPGALIRTVSSLPHHTTGAAGGIGPDSGGGVVAGTARIALQLFTGTCHEGGEPLLDVLGRHLVIAVHDDGVVAGHASHHAGDVRAVEC